LPTEAEAVKGILGVTSEGRNGPAFIRFSEQTIARTEPWEFDGNLVVDYDAAGEVVGIELVVLGADTMNGLLELARVHDLDLSALVAHSFQTSPAA
jgi:hypothetical protein